MKAVPALAATLVAFGPAAAPAAEPLADALARIEGAEVVIDGHIGTGLTIGDAEALNFRDPSGALFPVIMDAGRDARKSLAGCQFKMFGGGTPCAVKGVAVIERDASKLRLAITRLDSIAKPATLP